MKSSTFKIKKKGKSYSSGQSGVLASKNGSNFREQKSYASRHIGYHSQPDQRQMELNLNLTQSVDHTRQRNLLADQTPVMAQIFSNPNVLTYNLIPPIQSLGNIPSGQTFYGVDQNFQNTVGKLIYRSPVLCDNSRAVIDLEMKQIEMTPQEYDKRMMIYSLLNELICPLFPASPNMFVEIFGSLSMKLALPASDLDIRIIMGKYLRKEQIQQLLWKIKRHIQRNFSNVKDMKVIPARVPIIKMVAFDVQCDISILPQATMQARGNISLIQNVLSLDPRIRPLILAVKQFAKDLEIGDASKRMLNSYGWTLLVISFLQNISPPIIPPLNFFLDGSVILTEGAMYELPFYSDKQSKVQIYNWAKRVEKPNSEPCSTLFHDFLLWHIFSKKSSETKFHINVRSGVVQDMKNCKSAFYFHIADPLETNSNVARALNSDGWDVIYKALKF